VGLIPPQLSHNTRPPPGFRGRREREGEGGERERERRRKGKGPPRVG